MENITLGQIGVATASIVALVGGVEFILARFNKIFDKKLKPINTRLDNIELSNAKNYIVKFLSDVEKGKDIDDVVKERFYENYKTYKELGGNSYVKRRVEKLEEENKL